MKKADALAYFGSQSLLAKALGIKPAAVSQWGDHAPELRAYQIERLSDGKLKVADYKTPHKSISGKNRQGDIDECFSNL